MNNIEILEELSDNEHSRWANWQKYVHSKCIKNKDGSLTIPKEYVDHWNYEINTEYKDLPENIKESDRKEARKILETLNYKNLIQENKELYKNYLKLKSEMEILNIAYIPKLKVKELSKKYEFALNGYDSSTADYIHSQNVGRYMACVELLKEGE